MHKPRPNRIGLRHKPRLYKAHSWDWVVEEFAKFTSVNPQCEPIHEFVSRVAAKYGKVLFPIMSMHTLYISPSPEFVWSRDALRVDFDCVEQKFLLEYLEQPEYWKPLKSGRHWRKECDASEGFGAFERFLALKKWIVELPPERETEA